MGAARGQGPWTHIVGVRVRVRVRWVAADFGDVSKAVEQRLRQVRYWWRERSRTRWRLVAEAVACAHQTSECSRHGVAWCGARAHAAWRADLH